MLIQAIRVVEYPRLRGFNAIRRARFMYVRLSPKVLVDPYVQSLLEHLRALFTYGVHRINAASYQS
eukprot:4928648-Pleurochrysis_carterae.AAC.2